VNFPEDIDMCQVEVATPPGPAYPAVCKGTDAGKNFLFTAQGTGTGGKLLPDYLYYFSCADQSWFENQGQSEGATHICRTALSSLSVIPVLRERYLSVHEYPGCHCPAGKCCCEK
jgi:hypothetical protein